MPVFYYKAQDVNGALFEGSIEADDTWVARKKLASSNLKILKLDSSSWDGFVFKIKQKLDSVQDPVSVEDRLILITQLETGFAVGISPVLLLDAIQQDIVNPKLKKAIIEIGKDVSQGNSLYVSFCKHPKIFDPTFLELIRTGEVTGEMEKILQRIFKITEQKFDNLSKVKSATLYPKIVMGFMVVVVLITVYYVIPKIKVFLSSIGQDLPPITKMVMGVSDFCVHFWPLIGGLFFGGQYAFKAYQATEKGRLKIDQLKLKIAIFGSLFLQIELVNFCVILDLLVESGIPFVEALNILQQSQSNYAIRQGIWQMAQAVSRGQSLYQGISESGIFPKNFVGLLKIGEESGKIPEVLRRIGKQYQIQVDYRLNNLSKLIEPLLLFVIFVLTLILALAIFLPIWRMSSMPKN